MERKGKKRREKERNRGGEAEGRMSKNDDEEKNVEKKETV